MKVFGIDVSKYQGAIDWAKAKAGGVKFAMLKAVSTNNTGLYIDPYFERNYAECKRLGIPCGVYGYFKAVNREQADKELAYFKKLLTGRSFELPVAVDIEDEVQKPLGKAAVSEKPDFMQAPAVAAPVEEAKEETIDFSKVVIEPAYEEYVDFDTFCKSDIRVVKVKECTAVPKSKKLLKFVLNDGTGTDCVILSGIHAFYEPEELVGKTLVAIVNLPPRKMMGIDSCGMLLSAIHEEEGAEKLNLIMVDNRIPAGARLH